MMPINGFFVKVQQVDRVPLDAQKKEQNIRSALFEVRYRAKPSNFYR